jgi:hypothetical protein
MQETKWRHEWKANKSSYERFSGDLKLDANPAPDILLA